MIRQGDLFWVDLGEPSGSGPGLRRPFVVVQNDLFNRSRLATVIQDLADPPRGRLHEADFERCRLDTRHLWQGRLLHRAR